MHAHYEMGDWCVDTMYEDGGELVEEMHDDYEWFGPLPGKLTPKPNKHISDTNHMPDRR